METVNPIVRNALNLCEKPANAGAGEIIDYTDHGAQNGADGGTAGGLKGDDVLARLGGYALVRDCKGAYWMYDANGNGRKLDAPDENAAACEFRKLATLATNGKKLRRVAALNAQKAPAKPLGKVWDIRVHSDGGEFV